MWLIFNPKNVYQIELVHVSVSSKSIALGIIYFGMEK